VVLQLDKLLIQSELLSPFPIFTQDSRPQNSRHPRQPCRHAFHHRIPAWSIPLIPEPSCWKPEIVDCKGHRSVGLLMTFLFATLSTAEPPGPAPGRFARSSILTVQASTLPVISSLHAQTTGPVSPSLRHGGSQVGLNDVGVFPQFSLKGVIVSRGNAMDTTSNFKARRAFARDLSYFSGVIRFKKNRTPKVTVLSRYPA